MQEKIEIAQAQPKHLEGITDLWKEFVDYHGAIDDFYTRRLDGHLNFRTHVKMLLSDDLAAVWVALENDGVIGYLIATIETVPPVFLIEKQGQIWDLAVKEEFRSQGIGERLLNHCKGWFTARDIQTMVLRVLVNNEPGLSFWRKHGFVERVYEMRRILE